MSHWPCDSKEDTGAASTLGWERLGHKPRSAHEEVAQPARLPEELQSRGFISVPHAAFFLFKSKLGSLHGAFTCASNLPIGN